MAITLTDKQVDGIAQDLEMGLSYFIHRKTGETVTYFDPNRYDLDTDDWDEPINKVASDRENPSETSNIWSKDHIKVMNGTPSEE